MKQFMAGYLICWASMSLHADILGKEKYAQWATQNWTDASTTVPLAIIAIVISIYMMVK